MSKLRRQQTANTTNVVETKNLVDIKGKTGNLYESIVVVAKRANQINITIKEELHKSDEARLDRRTRWRWTGRSPFRGSTRGPTTAQPK